MNINTYRLKNKFLYLITNTNKFKDNASFIDAVALALQNGINIVQLNENNSHDCEIIKIGKILRTLCSEFNALFIVNNRVDIAYLTAADGVHLGQKDINIVQARKILGNQSIIGITTHSQEQALEAQKNNADYIFVDLDFEIWANDNINIPFYVKNKNNIKTLNIKQNFILDNTFLKYIITHKG